MSSDVQRYFDENAEQYSQHGKVIPEFIIRQLQDVNPQRVVDIGCGSADFLAAAADVTNAEVIGSELSKEILPEESPAHFILGGAPKLPFPDQTFDLTRIDTVIHHIVGSTRSESKDLATETLKGLLRITNRDGRIIITERHQEARLLPDLFLSSLIFSGLKYGSFLIERLDPRVHSRQPPIAFYTESEFREMIQQAGGRITDEFENRYTDLPVLQGVFQRSSLRKTWVVEHAD